MILTMVVRIDPDPGRRGWYICDTQRLGGTGHYLWSDGVMRGSVSPAAENIDPSSFTAFWATEGAADEFLKNWVLKKREADQG